MVKLSEHQSGKFTKVLLIGDSGSGKTGSLASLVPEYDLRILDLDNGLDPLKAFVKRDHPDRMDSIDYESVRDQYRASKTEGAVAKASAFVETAKLLTEWSDGSKPSEWGEKTILVVDSLTTLGNAAYSWAQGLDPSAKDKRQWFGNGMTAIENIISMITSDDFQCNVVVIAHINYTELQDGTIKGHPSALGNKLGPKIGRYFNNLVLAERSIGGNKREIRLVPNDLVDVKTSAPFAFSDKKLPLETGMADLFRVLKSN